MRRLPEPLSLVLLVMCAVLTACSSALPDAVDPVAAKLAAALH